MAAYKDTAHRRLNADLRSSTALDANAAALRDALDAALALGEVPEPIVVYRGARWSALPDRIEHAAGRLVVDRGYTSTALLERVARRFADPLLMRIVVPAGVEAIPCGAPDLVLAADEGELLLGRGTVFRIGHFEPAISSQHPPIVHLEVIP